MQIRRGKVRTCFLMNHARTTSTCRDIAAQRLASAAVGECYEIRLCVDIRQQAARRDASAPAGRTSPGLTAPPACPWAASSQLAVSACWGGFKIWFGYLERRVGTQTERMVHCATGRSDTVDSMARLRNSAQAKPQLSCPGAVAQAEPGLRPCPKGKRNKVNSRPHPRLVAKYATILRVFARK